MTEARELYMITMSSSLSVDVCSSDQHKDVTKARQLRDVRDTLDVISLLRERDPSVQNNASINIARGLYSIWSIHSVYKKLSIFMRNSQDIVTNKDRKRYHWIDKDTVITGR